MVKYTTPGKVNKALKAAGLEFEIVKGRGYFWFDNRYPETNPLWKLAIPSFYEMRISNTPAEIVADVQAAVDKYKAEPSSLEFTKDGVLKLGHKFKGAE